MSAEELQKDVEDLQNLLKVTTRPRMKDLLTAELQRCQAVLEKGTDAEKRLADNMSNDVPPFESKSTIAVEKFYKDITNYAWDQSDKFMKIYITLSGLEKLSKESVTADFTNNSFRVKVENLEGKNYQCHVGLLWAKILPADSFHKIKSDYILVMLRKAETGKTWAFVTEREGKDDKKKKSKFEGDKEETDPSSNLMNMLKQMYDDGDDEMKRTIAKSWTESRNKSELS